MGVRGYQDLKVWQLGMQLARQICVLARSFPKSETHGLSSQVQRAAVSIPAKLAEGHGKKSTKESLRHVSIALGSLAQVETPLLLAQSLGHCHGELLADLLARYGQEGRMPHALRARPLAGLQPQPPTPSPQSPA